MKTLAEATGVVPRPPSEVLDELKRRLSGGYPMKFEFDAERGLVAVQGGWWYRGEYHVSGHPDGSRVTHRVLNVAERGAWGVPLANRFFIGFRRKVAEGFSDLIDELSASGPDPGEARTVLR